MPIRYSIDPSRRLVVSTAWDTIRFEEVVAHQQALLADTNFDPKFNQLIDATAVTEFELSNDEARTIAGRRLFSHSSRRAFVASTAAMFGIGRMLQAYHQFTEQAPQTSVFRAVEPAMSWLRDESDEPGTPAVP